MDSHSCKTRKKITPSTGVKIIYSRLLSKLLSVDTHTLLPNFVLIKMANCAIKVYRNHRGWSKYTNKVTCYRSEPWAYPEEAGRSNCLPLPWVSLSQY